MFMSLAHYSSLFALAKELYAKGARAVLEVTTVYIVCEAFIKRGLPALGCQNRALGDMITLEGNK
jgi:hypothetical protein